MSMVRAIIKEIGGRIQNAAGSINSSGNMFEGSSGNAPSDKMMSKIGMGNEGTNNPTVTEDSKAEGAADTATEDIGTDTEETEDVGGE